MWDVEKWKKVVFTDEERVELESKWRMFVRRPIGARNKTRYCIKFKYNDLRSLIFLGLISADGRRELVCCGGTMNSEKYSKILKDRFLTMYFNKILQQDNANCHYSRLTSSFMRSNKIQKLENYPPCSPDLNIIENLWSIMKDGIRRRAPINLIDLRNFADEEFHTIPDKLIDNLYQSLHKRIIEVIHN